jgi:hypothetical protein
MKKSKVGRAKDNARRRCIGYGKCISMQVETILDTLSSSCDDKEVTNEKITYDTNTTSLSLEGKGTFEEDSESEERELIPLTKCIYRYVINENCKHKCKLQKCVNYLRCGKMMPQWTLNLGGGLCEECITEELKLNITKPKDDTEIKRRKTI